MITRRRFMGALAAATVMPRVTRAAGFDHYRDAMVLDALSDLSTSDVSDQWAPLTAEAIADARSSGICALHTTVGVGGDSWDDTIRMIAWWEPQIDAHPEVLLHVRQGADLMTAKDTGRMGVIYGVQGLSMIGEDEVRLETLQRLGLRVAQLTYNLRAVTGDGCLEPADAGLSRFGRRVIEQVDALRMALDLSHGGRRTITEALAAAGRPLITHTGCAALHNHPRNVTDDALRTVAAKGGVIGIYFMPFLRPSGQPTLDDVVRHLEHAVNIAGEDHVGIGTDGSVSPVKVDDAFRKLHREFVERRKKAGVAAPGEAIDVFNFVPELNGPRKFEDLAAALARRGHTERRILKLLGGNFARAFTEIWG